MWKTAFKQKISAQVDHIPSNFLKAVFHKFYSVHSRILCLIYKVSKLLSNSNQQMSILIILHVSKFWYLEYPFSRNKNSKPFWILKVSELFKTKQKNRSLKIALVELQCKNMFGSFPKVLIIPRFYLFFDIFW